MKLLLRLEEAAMMVLALFALYHFGASWWWYLILLVGPDISMLGYLAGAKVGAVTYNVFHHKGIAIAIFAAGWWLQITAPDSPAWQGLLYAGIAIFGHSAMDRMLGFGLKYSNGFRFTHLGELPDR